MDNLSVFFLAEGEQSGDEVMARLTAFIRAARQSLDFAVYAAGSIWRELFKSTRA